MLFCLYDKLRTYGMSYRYTGQALDFYLQSNIFSSCIWQIYHYKRDLSYNFGYVMTVTWDFAKLPLAKKQLGRAVLDFGPFITPACH